MNALYLNLEKKQLNKLSHVKWEERFPNVSGNYPDFFIAGPQRSGTTWLATQLRRHPQIRMAWPKELYYFNRLNENENRKSFHHENIWSNISKSPRESLKSLAKVIYFDYLGRGRFQANQLQWYLSFFSDSMVNRLVDFSTRDFCRRDANVDLVCGEATASYAVLDDSIIDDMLVLNPDMKVVLTFRHPIERAWSHARKDVPAEAQKAMKKGAITEELQAFFQNGYQMECSNYQAIMEKWGRKLQPGHLLAINYHEIDNDPRTNLLKIWNLLAVDASWMPQDELLQSKINARKGSAVPEIVYGFLADVLRPQISWFDKWASEQR